MEGLGRKCQIKVFWGRIATERNWRISLKREFQSFEAMTKKALS